MSRKVLKIVLPVIVKEVIWDNQIKIKTEKNF